jgi:hypothetical protein
MRLDGRFFEETLWIVGDEVGSTPLATVAVSPSYNVLRANVEAAAGADDNARRDAMTKLEQALPRVSLLLDAAGAKALLADIATWGLSPAEPVLDMLHFNAALTSEITP